MNSAETKIRRGAAKKFIKTTKFCIPAFKSFLWI